ncbi:MAG: hypothetical protein QM765_51920 [Myxococcales bacterium]
MPSMSGPVYLDSANKDVLVYRFQTVVDWVGGVNWVYNRVLTRHGRGT